MAASSIGLWHGPGAERRAAEVEDAVPRRLERVTDGGRMSDDDVTEAAAIAAAEEVLHPTTAARTPRSSGSSRSPCSRDRIMAYGFVVAMLVVLPFILIAVWGRSPTTGIKVVLVAAWRWC